MRFTARPTLAIGPLQTTRLTEVAAGRSPSYTIDGPQLYQAMIRVSLDTAANVRHSGGDGQPNPPPPRGRAANVRALFTDASVARADDGRWVRRATIWLTHARPSDLVVAWPVPVRTPAVELDGRLLPPPGGSTARIVVPLPETSGPQQLRLVWIDDQSAPPIAPGLPVLSVDGEPIPAGPALWTVLSPWGAGIHPATEPLPPAAAALYRAAAQIELADAARAAGPTAVEEAKAASTRAAVELRMADAALGYDGQRPLGPDGISLVTWRQKIADALRPAAVVTSSIAAESHLPYGSVFAHGVPTTWYLPAGDAGPQFSWAPQGLSWPTRLLRTAAMILMGFVAVWWGRRLGALAWPEQLVLLGAAAWVASGTVIGVLVAVTGVVARVTLVGSAALRLLWPKGFSETPPGGPA